MGRNSKWGYDLPILMYVYVCCWFVKREIFVGYLLGMCLYYCVPYIRDGRCCVVEERFEGGEGLGFIHRDQRSRNKGLE